MKPDLNKLKSLLEKPEWHLEEIQWLLQFLESPETSELKDVMWEEFRNRLTEQVTVDSELSEKMLKKIHAATGGNRKEIPKIFNSWFVRVAAASAIIILLAGIFYFNQNEEIQPTIVKNEIPSNDIAPGGNKAILTLANGTRFVLDSANNGTITKQGNVTVIKLGDGRLAYEATNLASQSASIEYNTITTPRGGQYQIVLADGSRVWLNAASSITYPTAFTGKERKVVMTGEAYFEIAHNEKMPFIVSKGDVDIKVLGTHFNVNAYEDEGVMKVTLLEGKVNVSLGNESREIEPGQQAKIDNGSIILNNAVNTDAVMAWKNGQFYFDRADIKSVMKKISRWYDVEVEYEGKVTRHFGGTISRDVNASQVFEMLEITGNIHIKIEGKKVIVMP